MILAQLSSAQLEAAACSAVGWFLAVCTGKAQSVLTSLLAWQGAMSITVSVVPTSRAHQCGGGVSTKELPCLLLGKGRLGPRCDDGWGYRGVIQRRQGIVCFDARSRRCQFVYELVAFFVEPASTPGESSLLLHRLFYQVSRPGFANCSRQSPSMAHIAAIALHRHQDQALSGCQGSQRRSAPFGGWLKCM
jgi:hypothetical protein